MKYLLIAFLLLNSALHAQMASKAEPQVSFVKEDKPHEYYVTQAELWWEIVQEDKAEQMPWFHYYRACRNAQATANWSNDFVNESPALKFGKDIVALMEIYIPNTLVYNAVKGSTQGVDPSAGEFLLKAYKEDLYFEGLLANVVTYATSTHNLKLRQEANRKWYLRNDLSPELMHFAYNLLQSVSENGILFTQGDNDSYPVWMLQDAKGIRTDVLVVNIDFLLYEDFQIEIFKKLKIPEFKFENIDVGEYEDNWSKVVQHILRHVNPDRGLFFSQTVDAKWYGTNNTNLQAHGLTLKLQKEKLSETELQRTNISLLENQFLTDYLKVDLNHAANENRIREMNVHYLNFLYQCYLAYTAENQRESALEVKELAIKIMEEASGSAKAKAFEAKFN